jgi:hypothetical protein
MFCFLLLRATASAVTYDELVNLSFNLQAVIKDCSGPARRWVEQFAQAGLSSDDPSLSFLKAAGQLSPGAFRRLLANSPFQANATCYPVFKRSQTVVEISAEGGVLGQPPPNEAPVTGAESVVYKKEKKMVKAIVENAVGDYFCFPNDRLRLS